MCLFIYVILQSLHKKAKCGKLSFFVIVRHLRAPGGRWRHD